MVEVRIVVISGEQKDALGVGRKHRNGSYDAGNILFLDLGCGYLGEFSLR